MRSWLLEEQAGGECRMDLQWKDEPGQVTGALVQSRGWNRPHRPVAVLLVGVLAWREVHGALVTLHPGTPSRQAQGHVPV